MLIVLRDSSALFPSILFLLGIVFGSFTNVLIDRLPRKESFLADRSYCEHCKHQLKWFDLCPLFSYLTLKGKCRYCHAPIPARLFLVEFLTGLSFVIVYLANPLLPISVLLLYFLSIIVLIAIFFIDYYHQIIPDSLLIFLLLITITILVLQNAPILSNLVTGTVSFLAFFILFALTKGRGIGFGDVKFAFVIGLLLGFPSALIAFYAAFLTGAFISIILIVAKKKKFHGDTIAFGPFLVIGIGIAALFSHEIIQVFF